MSVNVIAENAAMLSWTKPTHRKNGEILTSAMIGGYTIKYGIADQLRTITINDPGAQHIQLFDLPTGKNVFLISAFDTKGLHGKYSEPVYKTIGRDRGESIRVP